MDKLPVHRVSILHPFAQFLEQAGAPVERGYQKAGLPFAALENLDNYVPSTAFYRFLFLMAHSEGIVDLGFRVGKQFGSDSTDPHMTELLKMSPTLYLGLSKASELVNRTITNCQVGILQSPNRGYSYFYHSPSCDADNPAIEQIGWFGLEILIGMVRVYAGPQWQPTEIGLMLDKMPSHYIREHFPHTRIRLSQPFFYIRLENTMLPLPPFGGESAIPSPAVFDYRPMPDDFSGSLEAILLSYIEEGDLRIELAAGLCNMSKRSLQRKLANMGTNYTELLDQARFRAASRLLQVSAMTATAVAYRLGYSDVAHFARAFRRIAGVNPTEYRQSFIQLN